MKTINNINYVEFTLDVPVTRKEIVSMLEEDIITCEGIITYIKVKSPWYLTYPLLYCTFLIPEHKAVFFNKLRRK